MSNKKIVRALDKVLYKLSSMPKDELLKKIEEHKNGDIASILLYSGTFKTSELENDLYRDEKYVYSTLPIEIIPKPIYSLDFENFVIKLNEVIGKNNIINSKNVNRTFQIPDELSCAA